MNDDRSHLRRSATEAFEDSLEQLKYLFDAPESATEDTLDQSEGEVPGDRASSIHVPLPDAPEEAL
jgi:hypothetical protein